MPFSLMIWAQVFHHIIVAIWFFVIETCSFHTSLTINKLNSFKGLKVRFESSFVVKKLLSSLYLTLNFFCLRFFIIIIIFIYRMNLLLIKKEGYYIRRWIIFFLWPCIEKDSCMHVLFMVHWCPWKFLGSMWIILHVQVNNTVKELEECRNNLRACLETNAKLTRYFIVLSFSLPGRCWVRQ